MSTYVWAWADEDGNYINHADSLSDILNEVLEYYSCDYDDFNIVEKDGKFLIQIDIDQESTRHAIEINATALSEFLNQQARLVGRPDKFTVQSMSY